MNGICTNTIHLDKKRLKFYGVCIIILITYNYLYLIFKWFQGNYDAFVRTREEQLENQMKQYNWEQDQIAHMKVNQKLYYYYYFLNCI